MDSFLKISFLLPTNENGGGARAIMRFGNELLKRGHKVRIFYRNEIPTLKNKIRLSILTAIYGENNWLGLFQGISQPYLKLDPLWFSKDEIILSMCTQTTFDLVSLPDNIGIKVLHCHGAEIENWEKMLESWRFPISKLVVSSHLIDMFKKEVNQEVIGIVPDGVDTSEYYPSKDDNERTGLGGSFRYSHTKDPITTINVFNRLHQELQGVPLYTFSNGKKPDELKKINYSRFPTVEQARDIYSSCKAWFVASIREGFSMPVLEAMACGCVVVSTDCGGPSDMIEHSKNGFLVEVGNIGSIVHKLKLIYNNPDLQKKMSVNAINTAKKFTWESAVDKLEHYLYQIFNEKS